MASETPGGSRKRKVAWQDDRSTNKYYASGDKRAIANQSPAEQQQPPPAAAPKRLTKLDDRSTDKYYANQQQQAPTVQQVAKGLGQPPRLGQQPLGQSTPAPTTRVQRAADPNASLTVNEPHEVNGVLQEVVNRLQTGNSNIVLYVQKGNQALLRRARAALEMLVTREIITEEQYHDVRLSYSLDESEQQALNAKLGAPAPREQVRPSEEEDDADFLASEEGAEETMAAVGDTQEVDTSDYPSEKAVPAADEEEDDDDNDFLELAKDMQVTPGAEPPEGGFVKRQQLRTTNDELDRAVATDRPVREVDEEERAMARKIEDERPRDADKTDEEKIAEVVDKNKQTTDPGTPGTTEGNPRAQAQMPVDDPSPGHPTPGEKTADRHRPRAGRRQGRGS